MIAPVTHPYPPSGYGPWERVTHDLTESLVAQGHDVTLFAPAGSKTNASLVETVPAPLGHLPGADHRSLEDGHIAQAMGMAADDVFDVVHSHLHVHALPHARSISCPMITTLHGAAWDESNWTELRSHADLPFVSLSDKEREFLPELNYVATIPNGIEVDGFPLGDGGGENLAFVGRIAPEKAPHLAIEVARETGRDLIIAGVVEDRHRDYAAMVFQDLGSGIDYVGPLDRSDIAFLLKGSSALVMPLAWDEPFGLVVVESLASGTPVVAWRRGAMPEIVEDGVTGFLVDDVQSAVVAVGRVGEISRLECRRVAADRFSSERMASDYSDVYRRVAA